MIKFNKFNKIKYSHKKIIIIIIVYLIFSYLFKGYFPYYPSIPVYPNNYKEAEKVKSYIKKRTKEDVNFFHLTNESIVTVFLPHVKETEQELYDIILSNKCETILKINKYLINRARPEQVDSSIKPIDKSTAQTPAFPAGHAFQAYLLSKKLSEKYPEKKKLFEKIAKKCDLCRVQAGLHYPSDGEYSKKLVDLFY